ncbi:FAD-NAD(P)-binding family protein [Mycobacterium kansasii]|uniref:L-lysine N6-monooxygenase MbtG n=1 Tax=Mycobacterium kansasii TaxID=1768 RepID=A0A1V3XJB0_MYCKA|nr:FAD-NAD(P)-binding family protein [Mycobacterium kansasii]
MRFSWQSYLVATDQLVGWIDRGRPAPTHDTWAEYLRWVADRVAMKVVRGEVVQISANESHWVLHTRESSLSAEALMVTGPGQPERSMLSGAPGLLSIAQFWERAGRHERIVAENVAVIGGGETAASVLNELFHHRVSAITAISRKQPSSPGGRVSSRTRCFPTPPGGTASAEPNGGTVLPAPTAGSFLRGFRRRYWPTRGSAICAGALVAWSKTTAEFGSRSAPTTAVNRARPFIASISSSTDPVQIRCGLCRY